MLSFQPPHPGSIRAWVANTWNRTIRSEEGYARSNLFLFQNLALQLGLGQQCQPDGYQLRGSSFFAYESDVPLRLSAAPCVVLND